MSAANVYTFYALLKSSGRSGQTRPEQFVTFDLHRFRASPMQQQRKPTEGSIRTSRCTWDSPAVCAHSREVFGATANH